MSQQIALLSVSSYQSARKPVRGRRIARQQLDLFAGAPQIAKPKAPKKGQRFFIVETGRVVKYMGQAGGMTLWESGGDVYRATWAQVKAVSLEPLH